MGSNDAEPHEKTYLVKKGDTLAGIAIRHKLNISDLKIVNHLLGSDIFEGQILHIKKRKRQRSKSLPMSALMCEVCTDGERDDHDDGELCTIPNQQSPISTTDTSSEPSPPTSPIKLRMISKMTSIRETCSTVEKEEVPVQSDNEDESLSGLNRLRDRGCRELSPEEDVQKKAAAEVKHASKDEKFRVLSRSQSETVDLTEFYSLCNLQSIPKLIGGSAAEILCDPKYSTKLVSQLENELPRQFRGYDWKLLYSLSEHGASLGTLYQRTRGHSASIVVVETSKGEVFGCFASKEWQSRQCYYGNGECFLFTTTPSFQTFKWGYVHSMFMFSNEESFAMGGGGSFGMYLNSDFSKGSSGRCSTFDNRCLTSTPDFDIFSVEVWSFVTRR